MHRWIVLACAIFLSLEATLMLAGWLKLLASGVPSLLRSADYWWAQIILGCASVFFALFPLYLWFELVRALFTGGGVWTQRNHFEHPNKEFIFCILMVCIFVFGSMAYVFEYYHGLNFGQRDTVVVAAATAVQYLILHLFAGYHIPTQVPAPPSYLAPSIDSKNNQPEQPEIGFDKG